MYDPVQTLAAIDDHKWVILPLMSLAMICNYAWFFSAYRQAMRDQAYAIPIFCSLFWLVGDATVVINFDRAFNTYDHWYPKLFWVALVFTVAFELVYIRQLIRYGRKELLPSWTQQQFAALILAGVAAAAAIWATFQAAVADDLHIVYFHLANVAMPLFWVGMLIRRRTSAGTNRFIWAAYLTMQTFWYIPTLLFFGDDLQRVEPLLLWIITTAGCALMIWLVGRVPRPATPPAGIRPTNGAREEVPAVSAAGV